MNISRTSTTNISQPVITEWGCASGVGIKPGALLRNTDDSSIVRIIRRLPSGLWLVGIGNDIFKMHPSEFDGMPTIISD